MNKMQPYKELWYRYEPVEDAWYISDDENLTVCTLAKYNAKVYRIDQAIEHFKTFYDRNAYGGQPYYGAYAWAKHHSEINKRKQPRWKNLF